MYNVRFISPHFGGAFLYIWLNQKTKPMKKLLFLLPLLAIISCDKTDTENSGDAQYNSRGCLECDNYTAGQSFLLDGIRYEVADEAMLLTAIVGGDDLTKYCTSKIMDMSFLFYNVNYWIEDISTWDVSNVTNMAAMFRAAYNFNQDIGNWDVSSVTNMDLMFSESDNFNQDLTQWCVSQFPAMPYLFGRNSVLTTSNHPDWGTCP
jgi:surface protein